MNTSGRKTSRWKGPEVEKSLLGKEQSTDQNIVSWGKGALAMAGQVSMDQKT